MSNKMLKENIYWVGYVDWDVRNFHGYSTTKGSTYNSYIIKDKKIVGILDFERTDWSSIDYNLDVINRMVKEPHKYVSEESDKYIKDKDYADLLTWFKEFYPELFKFKNLEKRLDIYTLSDCLGLLPDWSRSEGLKNIISSIIKYKK